MTTRSPPPVIDHVTIAGSALDVLEEAFLEIGIEPEYGGEHDALPTHMSTVGFEDGTYVELISKTSSTEISPFWDAEMDGNTGPCAWSIRSSDIERDVHRIRESGIDVDGPHTHSRDRPDGKTCEWKLAFPGEEEPGTLLPFLIQDVTPREWRIQPTPSAASAGFVGITTVVLAIEDVDVAMDRFERTFEHSSSERTNVETGPFSGTVVEFPGTPVVLVSPRDNHPLAERLHSVGDGPCGFVFHIDDPSTRNQFDLLPPTKLGSQEVFIIDPAAAGEIEYLCLI